MQQYRRDSDVPGNVRLSRPILCLDGTRGEDPVEKTIRRVFSALALAIALAPALAPVATQAGEMRPAHAHPIELKSVTGVAYYTVEAGQYQVVAVLAADDSAAPVRFVATLEPGQRFTISVPGAVGEREAVIEIVRQGDTVIVAPVVVASN
jgi:hypothetical protein